MGQKLETFSDHKTARNPISESKFCFPNYKNLQTQI